MADDEKVLSLLRSGKRQSVTKTIQKLDSSLNTFTLVECKYYLDKLEDLKTETVQLDREIDTILIQKGTRTKEKYLAETLADEQIIDSIRHNISLVKAKISSLSGVDTSTNRSTVSNHKVVLPNIELPSFDGKPESYNKFIVSFENLICKYNLSSFEKFSYLSKQLTGSPKKIIESLSLNDLNYENAKNLLNEAYSNKLDQQFSVITKLCELKLDSNSVDAYAWIGDSRLFDEQIRSLDITADIFTQFFLWRGLPENYKKHITAITNKTRPSLTEIKDAMFEANSRYIEERKCRSQPCVLKTVSAAASVDLDTKFECSLCTNDKAANKNHKLNKCPKYCDANSKVVKLNAIGGCTKCGFTNHNSKTCSYTFEKSCFKCGGPHMSFLCDKNMTSSNSSDQNTEPSNLSKKPVNNSNSKKSEVKTTTAGVVSTVSMTTESYNDVILPTATVYSLSDDNKTPMRLFKDVGSQSTFVKGQPDDIPGAEILRRVSVKLKGINSVKTYDAPVVKFPIEIPGQGTQSVEAICVPTLNTEFVAPGLVELVSKFRTRGVLLADSKLTSDSVSDISILLGSDQGHLLPLTQFNFRVGEGQSSVLYQTPAGIVLAGSVLNYNANLPAIPSSLCNKQ